MAVLDELVQTLGFDIDDGGLKQFQSTIAATTLKMGALAAGAFTVVGAIRAVLDAASDTAGSSRFARSIDVAFESLQRLEFAATDVGVSAGTLRGALSGLRQTTLALASGLGSEGALAAFAHLGISIRDANGNLKTADALLLEIADRVKNSNNPALAQTLAEQLGLGTELTNLLRLGADGIRGLGNEAQRMGIILGTDAAKASEEFDSKLMQLKKTGRSLLVDVGLPIVEWTRDLIDGFLGFTKTKDGRLAIDLMKGTVSGLLEVIKLFGEPFRAFFALWERFGPVAVAALAPIVPFVTPLLKLINPFTKLRLAALGALAAMRELRVFMSDSGTSIFHRIFDDLGIGSGRARSAILGFPRAVGDFFSELDPGQIFGPVGSGLVALDRFPLLPGIPSAYGTAPTSDAASSFHQNVTVMINGADNPAAVAERVKKVLKDEVREGLLARRRRIR